MIQTYGKIGFIRKNYLIIRDRFKPNKYSLYAFQKVGLGIYTPKINKVRLSLGIVGAAILIVAPFLTILAPLPIMWGLK